MTPDVIKIILGVLGIVATVLAWWFNKNNQENKKQDEIDQQIDAATNAADILNVSGKLRNKR